MTTATIDRATMIKRVESQFRTAKPSQPPEHDALVADLVGHYAVSPEEAEEIIEAGTLVRPLAELLEALVAYFRDRVVLTEDQHLAVALWVAATHVVDAAETAPLLHVRSPEKGSGKTVLQDSMELVVHKPWRLTSASTAAFFRYIEAEGPTVLWDEIDQVFAGKVEDHAELVGAIDSGIYRGGGVVRAEKVKGGFAAVKFDCFGMKCIAGIGTAGVPEQILDRSIPVVMKRKTSAEKVMRLRRRREKKPGAEGPTLQRELARWGRVATENLEARIDDEIALPESLSDRQQNIIEILVAVADSAGGDWGERARGSLERIITEAAPDEGAYALPKRALADARTVFAKKGNPEKMFTADLVAGMRNVEDAPWGDKQDGKKPLDAAKLGYYLGIYGIKSKPQRIGSDNLRGYRLAYFEDAWERFLDNGDVEVAETQEDDDDLDF